MPIKLHILNYLKNAGRAVKRKELLAYLRTIDPTISDRQLRKMVESAIREGELIESSVNGYSIILTEESLNRAVSYLNSKLESLAWRRSQLIHNWREKNKELNT